MFVNAVTGMLHVGDNNYSYEEYTGQDAVVVLNRIYDDFINLKNLLILGQIVGSWQDAEMWSKDEDAFKYVSARRALLEHGWPQDFRKED